jgi:hypothetical protein
MMWMPMSAYHRALCKKGEHQAAKRGPAAPVKAATQSLFPTESLN